MRKIIIVGAIFFVPMFLGGCEKFPSSNDAKFTVTSDGKGRVIGESYIYKGNGKFQHQKTVKFEDLK